MTRTARRQALATAIVSVCALALSALPAPAFAAQQTMRVGLAPRSPADARALGRLPGRTDLQLVVALEPRSRRELANYAEAVSTPGSVDFRRYLTPGEFRRLFGASAAAIAHVDATLRARGLDPGPVSANGLLIPVDADARIVARGLATPFERYRLASGRIAFANTEAPRFTGSVAQLIQGVIGLNDLVVPHALGLAADTHPHRRPALEPRIVTGGPQPCALATVDAAHYDAYTADEVASAYNFASLYATGDEGAGQTVALVELEPDNPLDIQAYQNCYATGATVNYDSVDGGAGAGDGQGEAALDIENIIGLAPKATIDVYQAPRLGASYLLADYAAIVANPAVTVISSSWGLCESAASGSFIAAEGTLFQQAAAEGQSVFAAAGDDGSSDCATVGSSAPAVDDPASQPFVTGVGGLTLTSTSYPPAETVWNDWTTDDGAGGGGISALHSMPAYQADAPGINVVNDYSSGVPCAALAGADCREVPDVSASADPNTGGYMIFWDGGWLPVGGTSAAAPLWAAFAALTNASSACAGHPIGFANPKLYAAAASAYGADFTDVTTGGNDYPAAGYDGGLYPAEPGYDMASGLGSPNGATLPAALCRAAADTLTTQSPGPQTATVGTAVNLQLSANDADGASVTFTAGGLPAGLSISAGGLISGTPTTAGSSTVTVTATALTGAAAQSTFTWSVAPKPNVVTVSDPGNQSGTVGLALNLQLAGADSGNASLSFAATGLPPGLSISSGGLISGTPTAAGTTTVTVTAVDTTGVGAQTAFVWTVVAAPTCGSAQLLANPEFGSGMRGWTASAHVIVDRKQAKGKEKPHSGSSFAWLGGHASQRTATLSQTVAVPLACHRATLTFWRHVDTTRPRSAGTVDRLEVQLVNGAGTVIKKLATYSNLSASRGYKLATIRFAANPNMRVTVRFTATLSKRGAGTTDFCIDDTSLTVG